MNELFENRTNSNEIGLLINHLRQYPSYAASRNILAVYNYETSAIIKSMQQDGKFVDCMPYRRSMINFHNGSSKRLRHIPISFKTYDLLVSNCKAFTSKWEVFTPSLRLNDMMEMLFKNGILVPSTKIIVLAFDDQLKARCKYVRRSLFHRLDGIITPRKGYKDLSGRGNAISGEFAQAM
jgi:hypothetical protein